MIDDAVEPFSPKQSMSDMLAYTKNGVGVTGVEDGKVMACGGIAYMSDTEGTIWLKVSRKCLENRYSWARTIREVFSDMEDYVNLTISTYILNGFCQGEKMARMIGLSKTDETEVNNGNLYYRYSNG